jgi:Mce-associated membrane protein
MAKANEPATDSATVSTTSRADLLAMAEEAEAEAVETEALAAAARARARAARLRREAQALARAEEAEDSEIAESTEVIKATEPPDVTEVIEADETVEAPLPAEDETVEVAIPKSATKPSRRLGRLGMPTLPTITKAAAILLIIGFTGFSGFAAWKHHESTQRAHRAAAFEAGARQGVINMTSLDFKRAKEDVQRVIDSSTGEFRDDFQQRANDFAKVVEESKVVTEGTVNAAAVESMDDHSAQVLISATSKITNSAGAKDEPRAWRLRVWVTEEGGQYKMSKVEFVP